MTLKNKKIDVVEVTSNLPDGIIKVTRRRRRFGSSYKKKSSLIYESTEVNIDEINSEFLKKVLSYPSLEERVGFIESAIHKYLGSKNLPIKKEETFCKESGRLISIRHVWDLLKKEHMEVAGATEASDILFNIHVIRQHIETKDFEKATDIALIIAQTMPFFLYAVSEAQMNIGAFRATSLIESNQKLNNEQYRQCFSYFETTLTTENGRALNVGQRWTKTKEYVKNSFGVDISVRTLQRNYKAWNS